MPLPSSFSQLGSSVPFPWPVLGALSSPEQSSFMLWWYSLCDRAHSGAIAMTQQTGATFSGSSRSGEEKKP